MTFLYLNSDQMTTMKHSKWIAITVTLIACAAGPAAMAKGKQPKENKLPPSAESAQVFAKYDTDHNGILNVEEAEAIASAFRQNPNDPMLKPFDTDHDGKLSDKEIMAIPAPKGAAKPNGRKK